MQTDADGLVLSHVDLPNESRIFMILTKEIGLISAVSNRSKSLKGKIVSATDTFVYSHFELFKSYGKDLYVIDFAEPIEHFYNLRTDLFALSLVAYLSEITQSLSPQGEQAEGFLRLLLNCLYLLANKKREVGFIKPLFELRACSMAGFMPDLICCCECGKYEDEQLLFNIEQGKLYCSCCGKKDTYTYPIPLSVLTAMRYIIYSDLKQLFSFSVGKQSEEMLQFICEKYLLIQTGVSYKSLDYYKSLTMLS